MKIEFFESWYKEKPVDGKYKYEEFMDKYEQFLKHHHIKDQ